MTIVDAAITVIAEQSGWMFHPSTWECSKVVMLNDKTMLPLVIKIEIIPQALIPGRTKEEAEAQLMLGFLRALPTLLRAKQITEVELAYTEDSDDEDAPEMDEHYTD